MEQINNIKPLGTKIHKCQALSGKISDVTFNSIGIYCRRCGNKLEDEEVNPKDLNEIKELLKRIKLK